MVYKLRLSEILADFDYTVEAGVVGGDIILTIPLRDAETARVRLEYIVEKAVTAEQEATSIGVPGFNRQHETGTYSIICPQCRKPLTSIVVEGVPFWQCARCGAQYPGEEKERRAD